MALFPLLVATRDKLRSELKFADNEVIISSDRGRPPATMGNQHVAVWSPRWTPDEVDLNLALSELYDVTVTVTMRVNGIPMDSLDTDLFVNQGLTIDKIMRRCILSIHQAYDILTAANNQIEGDDKIIEPLRWIGGDAMPVKRGSEWLNTENPYVEQQAACFLTMQHNFARAKRVQAIHDSSRKID